MKKTTLLIASLSCLLLCQTSQGSTNYWDIDGATAGAGGATPAGIWDTGTTATWSADPNGASAGITWSSGDDAVFSAGTDAIGSFNVVIDTTQTAGNVTVEEGDVTFTGGTSLNVGGGNAGKGIIRVAAGATNTISTVLTGGDNNNQMTKTGAGRLVLSADNFNGGTSIGTNLVAEGVMVAANAGALGNSTIPTIVSNGASLNLSAGFTFNEYLILNGSGVANDGAMRAIGSGNVTWNTGAALGSDARIQNDTSGNFVFGGSGGGVINGTVNANGFANMTVGGNGSLVRFNINANPGINLGTGTITKEGNCEMRFEVPGACSALYINGGHVMWRNNLGSGAGPIYIAAGAGELRTGASADPNLDNAVHLAAGANPVVNCNNGHTFTLSGIVDGLGGLSKTNSGVTPTGTLVLINTNTYSGNTTIRGGPLQLGANASISNSPIIDIWSAGIFDISLVTGGFVLGTGQTLKGTGSVLGNMIAQGTISPGSSIGTLTFTGDLTINGNLAVEVDNTGPSSDLISVTGLITNTGSGTVNVANVGPALTVGNTFQIFNQGVTNGQNLNVIGGGAQWNNNLAVDGTISVASLQPVAPATNLTISASSPTSRTLGGMGAANSTYYVFASTNIITPMTNWWVIGNTNSTAGGVIQFIDTQATNSQRFYRFGQPSP